MGDKGGAPGREDANGAAALQAAAAAAAGAGDVGRGGKGQPGGLPAGLPPVPEAQEQQRRQEEQLPELPEQPPEEEGKPEEETWLLLEYCDQGTLVVCCCPQLLCRMQYGCEALQQGCLS